MSKKILKELLSNPEATTFKFREQNEDQAYFSVRVIHNDDKVYSLFLGINSKRNLTSRNTFTLTTKTVNQVTDFLVEEEMSQNVVYEWYKF